MPSLSRRLHPLLFSCGIQLQTLLRKVTFLFSPIAKEDLQALWKSNKGKQQAEKLQESYLGFTVVRPLNKAIIGKTCLKPLESKQSQESNNETVVYPQNRTYKAYVFGRLFELNTVAFQEQDKAAAACASASLWTVFSVTGYLYHHPIPAPGKITETATKYITAQTRSFPNQGLTLEQMVSAHKEMGLDPLAVNASLRNIRSRGLLKAYVKAFIDCGVPIILAITLQENQHADKWTKKGLHAVAVTGYKLNGGGEYEHYVGRADKNYFKLEATRINTILVHDDQIGPFSTMQFGDNYFSTQWPDPKGVLGKTRARSQTILLPYPKDCRMPIGEIHERAVHFDQLIKLLRAKLPNLIRIPVNDLTWDIILTEGHTYSEGIANSSTLGFNHKTNICINHVPSFVWIAAGYIGSDKVIEIVSDATDFGQRHSGPKLVVYNDILLKNLIPFLQKCQQHPTYGNLDIGRYGWLFEEANRLAEYNL